MRPLLSIRKNSIFVLFLVLLLTTEFYYIEVGAGVARVYHFLAVMVVFLFLAAVPKLFKSKVFFSLLLFFVVNIFTAVLSDHPGQAFASLTSFAANIAIVMAVALLLVTNWISIECVTKIILMVTIASIIWCLIQIAAYRMGFVLALSEQQQAQIFIGYGPAFRTEANTFGKFLVFPILFFLPLLIRSYRDTRLRFFYLLMLVGVLFSFTRTAIVGILAGVLFAFFWHSIQGRFVMVSSRMVLIAIPVVVLLGLTASGALPVSDYTRHKLDTLFIEEEWTEGGSSAYRLESMEAVIASALADDKKMILGNGWGQTFVYIRGLKVQAGGADTINILGYAGLVGVVFYFLYTLIFIGTLARVARHCSDPDLAMFAEGLLFAAVGMFVTAQMSGYLIAPEYYLLLGAGIYTGLAQKQLYRRGVFP